MDHGQGGRKQGSESSGLQWGFLYRGWGSGWFWFLAEELVVVGTAKPPCTIDLFSEAGSKNPLAVGFHLAN